MASAVVSDNAVNISIWLERLRCGDSKSADRLVEELSPLVRKIVRSHLPARTAEEDLVQTVFMKMFANLHQYRAAVPLEHWVSRIAVNTCLNQLAFEKVRPEIRHADLSEEQVQVLESLATSERDLDVEEAGAAREIVGKLLERLPPTDRSIVTWLHLEGRSVQEIRDRTGWNLSLVKVRLFRARLKLRKAYRELSMEGGL